MAEQTSRREAEWQTKGWKFADRNGKKTDKTNKNDYVRKFRVSRQDSYKRMAFHSFFGKVRLFLMQGNQERAS